MDQFTPFNGLKAIRYSDKISEIIEGKIPAPITVEVDPSNACNHNCVFCLYKDFRKERQVMIPPKRLLRLCDELADFGVKSVTFTGGGEPLANPATVDAMYRLRKRGVKVGLVTNGGLLNNKKAQKAVIDCCRFMRVSLDSGSNEIHKIMHRPARDNEFDEILKNVSEIDKLRDRRKLQLGCAFLVHPDNYFDLENAVERASGIFDYIQVRPVLGTQIPYEILFSINDKINELKIRYKGKIEVYGLLHRFDELKFREHGFKKCRATPLIGVVGADQKLYICCQWRGRKEGVIGDISNKAFGEVWGSDQHKKIIGNIDVNKCMPCRYKIYNQVIENVFMEDKMHLDFL